MNPLRPMPTHFSIQYLFFISIGKAQHNDWFDSQPSTSSSSSSDNETILNPAKIVEKDSKTIEKVSKIVKKGSKANYDSIETSSTSEEEENISLQLQLLNQFPICDRFNKNAQIAKGSDFFLNPLMRDTDTKKTRV